MDPDAGRGEGHLRGGGVAAVACLKAQQYFLDHGGPDSDPDGLDADRDGVAFESIPCPCSDSTTPGGGGGGDGQPPAEKDDFGAVALNLEDKAGTSKNV
ncbi:hypothetical protein [Nocardioides sp.]|uniref:hypothetical protein n=1 Tax=Nocardioides sp. TaxID=35761 RepID=UPI002717B05D|nr:hypothetical protein [Nocardioides sp.]MDO9455650.1 hypothetical protein [Nocardioides sp.]